MKKTKSRTLIICIAAGVLGLFGLAVAVMKIAGMGPLIYGVCPCNRNPQGVKSRIFHGANHFRRGDGLSPVGFIGGNGSGSAVRRTSVCFHGIAQVDAVAHQFDEFQRGKLLASKI